MGGSEHFFPGVVVTTEWDSESSMRISQVFVIISGSYTKVQTSRPRTAFILLDPFVSFVLFEPVVAVSTPLTQYAF